MEQRASLMSYTMNPIETIAEAANQCYGARGYTSATRLVESLITRGHMAPFEFCSLTFDLTTNRAVMDMLLRHRKTVAMAYSQEYNKPKDAGLGTIETGRADVDSILAETYKFCLEQYERVFTLTKDKTLARLTLPMAVVSPFRWNLNLAEFLRIVNLRVNEEPQELTRQLMVLMLEELPWDYRKIYNWYAAGVNARRREKAHAEVNEREGK